MKHFAAVLIVAGIGLLGASPAFADHPKPDPNPTHGNDCTNHNQGNQEGNEDHCDTTTTSAPPVTTTTTEGCGDACTTTSTSTTTTQPPSTTTTTTAPVTTTTTGTPPTTVTTTTTQSPITSTTSPPSLGCMVDGFPVVMNIEQGGCPPTITSSPSVTPEATTTPPTIATAPVTQLAHTGRSLDVLIFFGVCFLFAGVTLRVIDHLFKVRAK